MVVYFMLVGRLVLAGIPMVGILQALLAAFLQ